VTWTWGLARLHHVPIMPGVLLGLGLCVWIVYVLDRVLDGVIHPSANLDRRHVFHLRWRFALLPVVLLSAGVSAYLALVVVPAGLMWQCVALGLMMLLYLVIFHAKGGGQWRWLVMPVTCVTALGVVFMMPISFGFQLLMTLLIAGILVLLFSPKLHEWLTTALSKDVTGGLLFALGCTTWTRFIQEGGDVVAMGLEFLLLGCLFVSNLTGISSRAAQGRWIGMGFGIIAGVVWLVITERIARSLGTLAAGCGLGFIALLLLDRCRKSLSEDAYRVWADLAVLVPLVWLVIMV